MAFLEASVSKMQKGLDRVARKIVIEVGNRLVYKSPVGNPKLWLSLHPVMNIKTQKLTISGKRPKGYSGGAFRRNWQHGFGTAPAGELAGTANVARAEIKASVNSSPAAGVHYIVNNLPYGQRLENGWSSQSPKGMVKLTALEFPEIVRQAQE